MRYINVFFFVLTTIGLSAQSTAPKGFTTLFNGKDLTNWKVPAGDNGHWKVVDGVIDYDAEVKQPIKICGQKKRILISSSTSIGV
jgi:hypothetical protein